MLLCSTLLLFRCNKKPDRLAIGHIRNGANRNFGSLSALAWLLDVAPFPPQRQSWLLMRHLRSASPTIRYQRGGGQPSGVGTLKVNAACVERATTIRTGSVSLMFISTWTMCGGTHTKSP